MTSAKPLPESSVLTALPPSTNSDDWPEFRLNDATVKLPFNTSKSPVSLLLASEHHPLIVTGRLEALPKEQTNVFLLPSKQRTPVIELTDVRSFAYGAYEDSSVEIWAAGKAGWFMIRPSKSYRAIYDEMLDAVNILYFIVDAYKTPRKRGKGRSATTLPDFTAQELFEKYAIEVMGIEKGAPEAAQKMYKHLDFLLLSMIEGKEGLTWSKNPLYLHLCRKFPVDIARIRERLAGPSATLKVKPGPARQVRQASHDSSSTTSSLKRKRGRPPTNIPAEDFVSIRSSSAVSLAPQKPVTQARTTKKEPNPKPKTTRSTRQTLKPSAPTSAPQTPEIQESQTQDSDSDTIAVGQHKRKSALRLKPNKPSKGLPRSSKAPPAEDEDEDELSLDQPAARTGGKRKRDHHEQPTIPKSRRRSTRHEVDEGISMPTSPSASEGNPGSPFDTSAGAADEQDLSTTELAVRLLHKPDTVQEDVWVCALDGCTHKVYSASLPQSQKLIREHYALHAYDDDDRVQMVRRLAAPSLPVVHLMEKVKMQAKMEGFPGSRVAGTRFPEPLRQKF